MPRVYKTREGARKRVPIDEGKLRSAVDDVIAGASIRGTAKGYGLAVMTLKTYVRKRKARMQTLFLIGRESNKHGGITYAWLANKCYVVMSDPVDLEVVLKTALNKDDIMRFSRNLVGNGSIFAAVPIWRPRRKILAPTFSPKNLQNFSHIFTSQSQVLVAQLRKVAGTGIFSVWQYLTAYTMDSICETALGVKMNVQKNEEEPFLKAFENASRLVANRTLQPWLHHDAVYSLLPQQTVFNSAKNLMYNFVEKVIQTKKAEVNNTNENELDKVKPEACDMKTFLELLIETSTYSKLELLEETLVLVLGGTDTSAVGAAFAVSMLARHPDAQEKAYEELKSVLGDVKRPVTYEDLPQLKYLEVVIKESLRLYPAVPITVRKIEKDILLPSGITIVKGCGVMVHNWATNRNPKYWGEDAVQFRPERFLDTPFIHPAQYMSFSFGPRNCIGYQYALMSMKTALASLLSRYRVLPKDPSLIGCTDDIDVTFDIMMKDRDRFRIRLEHRDM